MAKILVAGQIYEIDLIAFDKDGTLIDFYRLWEPLFKKCVAELINPIGWSTLAEPLYLALGFDSQSGLAISDGPMATASLAELAEIAAKVLTEHDVPPSVSQEVIKKVFSPCLEKEPDPEFVHPVINLKELFTKLVSNQVVVTIITSDNRKPTEATLNFLGLMGHVHMLICGDDPISNKPSPESIHHICQKTGVPPRRVMVVGDNPRDLIMGRRADVGCCAGVLSGSSKRESLAPYADVILETIGDIEVIH